MAAQQLEFMEALKLSFNRLSDIKGRSRRSEFWWFALAVCLGSTVLAFIPFIGWLISLVLSILSIPVAIRRLHDVGKSGWCLLLSLIPIIGSIILLIWFCKDSMPESNAWGANPKA